MNPDERPRETLRIERTFAAPAGAVFAAWTSAAMLRRWWPAGEDWETPVAEVDLRVGGRLRLVMRTPAGEDVGGEGEYLEIAPPTRLAFTWRWDAAVLGTQPQVVEVTFTANADDSTTVVLVNRNVPEAELPSHHDGWQASFDNLDRVLLAKADRR